MTLTLINLTELCTEVLNLYFNQVNLMNLVKQHIPNYSCQLVTQPEVKGIQFKRMLEQKVRLIRYLVTHIVKQINIKKNVETIDISQSNPVA